MLRPVSLLPALVAAASLMALLLPAAAPAAAQVSAAGAARAAVTTPLAVTIESLSPSAIPERGPVRVTGSVTNRSEDTWTNVNLYAFVSAAPMTSTAELAAAAEVGPTEYVGARITETGSYDAVDVLAPGQTAQFSLRLARSLIPVEAPGVYWFGVHALGQSPEGRDGNADGRARTFLPLVPQTQQDVDTALVVPIRRLIDHAADGSVSHVSSWTESLSPGGTLGWLVELGAAAGARPITWLVDPAVPDTVRTLVAGNPPRSLAPTVAGGDDRGDDGGDGGGESGSPSPSATPGEGDQPPDDELSPAEAEAADAGAAWLERFREGLEDSQILTLPYGDVDVAAAVEHDPAMYRQARQRSSGVLQPWGLATTSAVSSPTGYIDAEGIQQTEPGTTLLVTDRMFGANAPSIVRTAGHTLGVTSSGAVSGGPGPTDRLSPLAVRQRIVSEAAIRLLTRGRKPLIVVFPPTWSPEPATGFFEGLDLDWLNLTSVSSAMQRAGTEVPLEGLDYPENQAKLELDAANFAAAGGLARAGTALQNLLTRNDQVGGVVLDEAMTTTSYSSRLRPETARASADRSRGWIEGRLRSVHIDAPKAVILSSGSGRFGATITNTLDQPVTVRIQAVADPPLKVAVPAESLELGPESRTTVLLNASSSALGIRNVRLLLTDSDDVPIGSSDDLPIRSNRVSNVIWVIIGTGVALLFGAIVVRLLRRIRTAARS